LSNFNTDLGGVNLKFVGDYAARVSEFATKYWADTSSEHLQQLTLYPESSSFTQGFKESGFVLMF
jgi:hypothetical protein